MVAYDTIKASNSCLPTSLPPSQVAVFFGATSGIGEYTLKAFAKHTIKPRIIFIGRSESSGKRIKEECKAINAEGEYVFLAAELSVLGGVVEVCERVKTVVEKWGDGKGVIDLLWLSQGTLSRDETTTDSLRYPIALGYYSRHLATLLLLPHLQNSTTHPRVVTCLAGTKEGPIDTTNISLESPHPNATPSKAWFPALPQNPLAARGHKTSLITLSLQKLATLAPNVSFIHDFPGPVKSGIARDRTWLNFFLRNIFTLIGPWIYIPNDESGERHLYLCTNGRYPSAAAGEGQGQNQSQDREGVEIARGADGNLGSGVYICDEWCESGGVEKEALLRGMWEDGTAEEAWAHTEGQLERVLGVGWRERTGAV